MKKIILCEGNDDAYFLGYYLHKTSSEPKWVYNKTAKISENYKFPVIKSNSEKVEIYIRGLDKLAIWAVGGKDSFERAIEEIIKLNNHFNHLPEEVYDEIVIVTDRDNNDIADVIAKIESLFSFYGPVKLKNNERNVCGYSVNDKSCEIKITPIIIPFESQGSLETVLMNAINEMDEESELVVHNAKKYINELLGCGKLKKYLQHERLKHKAMFSAVISVINPEKSTSVMNELLLLHDWENKDEIKKHFKLLEEV